MSKKDSEQILERIGNLLEKRLMIGNMSLDISQCRDIRRELDTNGMEYASELLGVTLTQENVEDLSKFIDSNADGSRLWKRWYTTKELNGIADELELNGIKYVMGKYGVTKLDILNNISRLQMITKRSISVKADKKKPLESRLITIESNPKLVEKLVNDLRILRDELIADRWDIDIDDVPRIREYMGDKYKVDSHNSNDAPDIYQNKYIEEFIGDLRCMTLEELTSKWGYGADKYRARISEIEAITGQEIAIADSRIYKTKKKYTKEFIDRVSKDLERYNEEAVLQKYGLKSSEVRRIKVLKRRMGEQE